MSIFRLLIINVSITLAICLVWARIDGYFVAKNFHAIESASSSLFLLGLGALCLLTLGGCGCVACYRLIRFKEVLNLILCILLPTAAIAVTWLPLIPDKHDGLKAYLSQYSEAEYSDLRQRLAQYPSGQKSEEIPLELYTASPLLQALYPTERPRYRTDAEGITLYRMSDISCTAWGLKLYFTAPMQPPTGYLRAVHPTVYSYWEAF